MNERGFTPYPTDIGGGIVRVEGIWAHTNATKVSADGDTVDMTDTVLGTRREVGRFTLVRTESGVKFTFTESLQRAFEDRS